MAKKSFKVAELFVGFTARTTEFDKSLKKVQNDLKKFSKNVSQTGKSLSKAFTLPLAGVALAAVNAGKQFDQASAIIRRGTGATGSALKALKADALAVFGTVDQSITEVSTVLADLNTRLGLSGKPLQALTHQVLDLAKVTNSDLNTIVATSTRVLGDWSISNENASGALDYLYKVSQTTGIGLDKLNETIVAYGAPLRQFGFSFEQATALIGKFEKEGVNTNTVFAGLRALLPKLAKEGIPLAEGFKQISEKIKGATDAATANGIAIAAFGSRAGADMAAAIREGRFEIDALTKSLNENKDTVAKAAEESLTLTEKIHKLGNAFTAALGPLGETIIEIVAPYLEKLAEYVKILGDKFNALSEPTKKFIVVFGGVVALIGPALLGIASLAGLIGGTLLSGIGLAVIAFGAIGTAIALNFDDISQFVDDVAGGFKAFKVAVTDEIDALTKFLTGAGELINSTFFGKMIEGVQDSLGAFYALAREIKNVVIDLLSWLAKTVSASENIIGGIGLATGNFNLVPKIKAFALNMAKISQDLNAEAQKKNKLEYESVELNKKITAEQKGQLGVSKDQTGEIAKTGDVLGDLFDGAGEGAKEAAKAVDTLADKLREIQTGKAIGGIREQIDSAIKAGNSAQVDTLKKQLSEKIYQQTLDGYEDAIEKGGDKALVIAKEIAQESVKEEVKEVDTKLRESLEEAHKKAVDFWANAFENAITGQKFNLEDMLGQVAVGFGSKIAASIIGGFDISSPQQLGQKLGQKIIDQLGIKDLMSGYIKELESTISGGTIGQSLIAAAPAAGAALGAAAVAMFAKGVIENPRQRYEDYGGNSAAGRGGRIQAAISSGGLSEVGLFGLSGGVSRNVETLARKKMEKFLEDLFDKIGGLKFFDSGGTLQNVKNVELGANSRFNNFDAGAQFEKFGGTTNAFLGISGALAELQGLAKETGDQIGFVLLEQFGGDVEALKAIVQAAGLSFEDLQESLLQVGKRGDESWLSVISKINESEKAFQKGIEGIGQFEKATDNFFKTNGKGQQSLIQLQNIANEAREEGIDSIDDYIARLTASGKYTQEQINALSGAFDEQGIKKVQQLIDAEELVLGRITAAVDARLQDQGVIWADQINMAEEYSKKLDEINNKTIEVQFNIKSNLDGNTEAVVKGGLPLGIPALAKGGIVSRPTLALIGEAGPEAVVPLSRKSGNISDFGGGRRSGQITINVDARGAAAGEHEAISNALIAMESRILDQVERMM